MSGWDGNIPAQLDLDKPIQTRDGREAVLIDRDFVDNTGEARIIVKYREGKGWVHCSRVMNGRYYANTPSSSDIINVPEKPKEIPFGDRPETKMAIAMLGMLVPHRYLEIIASGLRYHVDSATMSADRRKALNEVYFVVQQAQLPPHGEDKRLVDRDLLVDAAKRISDVLDQHIATGQLEATLKALRSAVD